MRRRSPPVGPAPPRSPRRRPRRVRWPSCATSSTTPTSTRSSACGCWRAHRRRALPGRQGRHDARRNMGRVRRGEMTRGARPAALPTPQGRGRVHRLLQRGGGHRADDLPDDRQPLAPQDCARPAAGTAAARCCASTRRSIRCACRSAPTREDGRSRSVNGRVHSVGDRLPRQRRRRGARRCCAGCRSTIPASPTRRCGTAARRPTLSMRCLHGLQARRPQDQLAHEGRSARRSSTCRRRSS